MWVYQGHLLGMLWIHSILYVCDYGMDYEVSMSWPTCTFIIYTLKDFVIHTQIYYTGIWYTLLGNNYGTIPGIAKLCIGLLSKLALHAICKYTTPLAFSTLLY